MNSEGAILYDTKKSGYKGLADYPVVIEALEMIEPVEKKQIIRKKETVERRIVFTIDSQLHYFFPSEELEASCVF